MVTENLPILPVADSAKSTDAVGDSLRKTT